MGEIIDELPKERTTMLFSATMAEEIERLCHKYLKAAEKIEISPDTLVSERVVQSYMSQKRKKNLNC